MQLNHYVRSASLECAEKAFRDIKTAFDVFSRVGRDDEIILDTHGWDPDGLSMKTLSGILDIPSGDLGDLYLILQLTQ